jgi:hypothetical protein
MYQKNIFVARLEFVGPTEGNSLRLGAKTEKEPQKCSLPLVKEHFNF